MARGNRGQGSIRKGGKPIAPMPTKGPSMPTAGVPKAPVKMPKGK